MVQEIDATPPSDARHLESYGPETELLVPGYYLVWLQPPVVPACRQAVDATGAKVLERHHDWYVMRVETQAQLAALDAARPWVGGIKPYHPDNPQVVGERVLTAYWDVRIQPKADVDALVFWLAQQKIQVVARTRQKLRIIAGEDQIGRLAGRNDVAAIAPYRPPTLRLDRARPLIGLATTPVIAGVTLTGRAQIVGVCDSGIDLGHAAFTGSDVVTIPRGRPGDASDPHGHGTHVCGTICGRANGTPYGGIAPDARLVMQSVMDAGGGLGGLPADLNELLQEAYDRGVRIHNDSWGADTRGAYTMSSLEVDEFVWSHPDMLVVIAVGNDGTAADPALRTRASRKGYVDWYSAGAPGTSKNALVVGACRSDRTSGGWAQLRYCDLWPDAFGDSPIAQDAVSGDPEAIAGFSSRGPCDSVRIKPDVVAPGTDLIAPRASTAPSYHFAGVAPGTNRAYGYMSGTSMATPIVTGLAALIRQYTVEVRKHTPSAALLKALIVNGARPLTAACAIADLEAVPNMHQGHGRVSLAGAIPLAGDFVLAFADEWQDATGAFKVGGANRRRYKVTTTQKAPLRVTLAYTDFYASGVQNNLDLIVEVGGKQRAGNASLNPRLVPLPDPANNVEVVRLDEAPAGDYYVSIIASNLLHDGQHFALVVAGALAADTLKEG
jgi:subtilisin family serine protease